MKKNARDEFWKNRSINTQRKDIVEYEGGFYSTSSFLTFWASASGQEILRRMEIKEPGSSQKIFESAGAK